MFTLLTPKATHTFQIHSRRFFSRLSSHSNYPPGGSTSFFSANHGSLEFQCTNSMLMCLSSSGLSYQDMFILKFGAKNRSQHLHVCASSGDQYRSSQNIAANLYKCYRNFVDRGGAENLKEFISIGVNAYSLGCTDEGLREELLSMKDAGIEIELVQTYGGKTGLKCKICSEEVRECILWLSIIFITILCTPQPTVIRWSSKPPVSDDIMLQWKGFCALIANAYYVKGMAWW